MESTLSAQKNYVREAHAGHCQDLFAVEHGPRKVANSSSKLITFIREDARWVIFPHNDPLVISVLVGNRTVHRILVDNESAVEILYGETLSMMGLKKEYLSLSPESLYGFTGDSTEPERTISIPIIFGEHLRTKAISTKWMVVLDKSSFNAIIGRPTLQELRAIISV